MMISSGCFLLNMDKYNIMSENKPDRNHSAHAANKSERSVCLCVNEWCSIVQYTNSNTPDACSVFSV